MTTVRHDVPFAELTTLRVGGPARRLERAETERELVDAALTAWSAGEEWLVLGGGSNLLVGDAGFDGTVLVPALPGIRQLAEDEQTPLVPSAALPGGPTAHPRPAPDRVRLRVAAGVSWDELVAETVERGLGGIEALSGIPGATGAAPLQNIGAYGQELAGVLAGVRLLAEEAGEVLALPAAELGLGYRTSALKRGDRRGIVTAVELDLTTDGLSAPVGYAQLASALGVRVGDRVPVAPVREAVLELRRSKGMVLDPQDPDTFSAGSFFTNPIVSERFARTLPPEAPRWPTGGEDEDAVAVLGEALPEPRTHEHRVKLSAAWLIEHAGIARGFALPGSHAAVSSKHTLALTNRGGASAEEIVELARYVRARVQIEFGVLLAPEPVLIGARL